MTSLFLSNVINEVMNNNNELTESNISLPKYIKIIDNNKINNLPKNQSGGDMYSATSTMQDNQFGGGIFSDTSTFNNQHNNQHNNQSGGDMYSATSTMQENQFGGGVFSDTSTFNNLSNNKLNNQSGGDMYSATSTMQENQFGGGVFSDTSTFINLSNKQKINQKNNQNNQNGGNQRNNQNEGNNNDIQQLLNMLTSESNTETNNFNGGALSSTSTNLLENKLKQNGGDVLNSKNVRNFFLDLKSKGLDVNVKINDKTMSDFFGIETTTNVSDMFINEQLGGGKSLPPALAQFQEMRQIIARVLDIPNGPATMKLASMIKKDFLLKYPDSDNLKIIKELQKFIESNKKHYENLCKNLENTPKVKKSSKKKSKKSKEDYKKQR